jgi:hypothetical protein
MKQFVKRLIYFIKRRYNSYKDIPIKSLVGMTSFDERTYWKSYTEKKYTGSGKIVDLGCWFGSTTFSLAEGLVKNKSINRLNRKIYAYDLFLWEDWMEPFVKGTKWEGNFKQEDSFLPVFYECIKKYEKFIEASPVDLTRESWSNGPIEFLLVDAMKSWELMNAIQQNFYVCLIPGKSIVSHQDFCHYYTYWIHLLNFRLRMYFKPEDEKSFGSSMSFRLIKPIPSEILLKSYSLNDFTRQEIEQAFEYSMQIVEESSKGAIFAAKIMCYKAMDGNEVAISLLQQAKLNGVTHYDLDIVAGLL